MILLPLVSSLVLCAAPSVQAGQALADVALKDAYDKDANIPDFGKKVIALFYTDADVADMNDPLADALKARKFDETQYRGMGVVDLADSKAPNFIIRNVVQGKIKKYNSTILTDPDHKLSAAWGLGDCNNTSVVVIVGKDGSVKAVKRGEIRGKDVDSMVELVATLIGATPAAAPAPAAAAPAVAPTPEAPKP